MNIKSHFKTYCPGLKALSYLMGAGGGGRGGGGGGSSLLVVCWALCPA